MSTSALCAHTTCRGALLNKTGQGVPRPCSHGARLTNGQSPAPSPASPGLAPPHPSGLGPSHCPLPSAPATLASSLVLDHSEHTPQQALTLSNTQPHSGLQTRPPGAHPKNGKVEGGGPGGRRPFPEDTASWSLQGLHAAVFPGGKSPPEDPGLGVPEGRACAKRARPGGWRALNPGARAEGWRFCKGARIGPLQAADLRWQAPVAGPAEMSCHGTFKSSVNRHSTILSSLGKT